jgi:hypothetical protein
MEKRSRYLRYGAWGALLAVIVVLIVVSGGAPARYLRSPVGLVLIAAIVGYAIFSRGRAGSGKSPSPQLEGLPAVNQIMRLAKEHKGRLTVAEVLAESSLELDEVRRTLDELAYAGTCQLIVGEKGTQVYYFAEFEDAATKGRDVLDTSEPSAAQKHAAQNKDQT